VELQRAHAKGLSAAPDAERSPLEVARFEHVRTREIVADERRELENGETAFSPSFFPGGDYGPRCSGVSDE
jgi:hypothetical protein